MVRKPSRHVPFLRFPLDACRCCHERFEGQSDVTLRAQAAAAFAWLFLLSGLGKKTFDLLGLVVQMVKAAAAFFGHFTLVGLFNVVYGARGASTQVDSAAVQRSSCICGHVLGLRFPWVACAVEMAVYDRSRV